MPNVNTQFQGQTLVRPGAYYADNVSGTATKNPGLVPPLIVIGYAFGGAKNVATTYSDTDDLTTAVRGGPVASLIPFLADPSSDLQGASQITFLNCGTNTQAAFSLLAGSTPAIDLTTTDFGAPGNLMQVQVSASSNGLSGACLITVFDGYANLIAQGDDIGVPLTIAYLGTATAVHYAVTATALTVTSANAAESFTIPLGAAGYATASDVAAYLNGTGFYSAIVQNDGTLPSQYLDAVATVALPAPTAGVATYVPVTAFIGDAIHWVNQHAANLVTAALHPSFVSGTTTTLAQIPLTHFAGGTNVPPVLADYAAALNAALAIPGWAVILDSNSLGVQALGSQHATTASSIVGRRPRRFFTGSSIGDTIVATQRAAQGLNSPTTTYVYPGIQRTNTTTGLNQTYGGLYAAAAAAAMASGNPVATPLTSKALVSNGVEVALDTTEIDALQQAGVMVVATNDAGVASLVSDLTTWQNDSNPENVFNQQIGCRQYLNYLLVGTAAPYVGQIAYAGGMGITRNAIVAALNGAIYAPGTNGVLSSWDPTSLTLTYTGATQTLAIQVNVTFVGQNRFITIYVPVQPLNLTA